MALHLSLVVPSKLLLGLVHLKWGLLGIEAVHAASWVPTGVKETGLRLAEGIQLIPTEIGVRANDCRVLNS